MKFSVLFQLAFLFQITASCQSDTSVVPIAAYWEKGDVYHFRVTRIKQTWNGRKLVQNDSTQYTARFEVVDADSASYTIKWSLKNMFFDSFELPASSRAKYPEFENTDVLYRTDEFGAFMGIENWQDISNMMHVLVNELMVLKSNDPDLEKLKTTLEPLLSVYKSRNGIEQLVFKELLMMHFPYGKQYTKGEFYNYEEKLPIMINTEPATGNGIIFIRLANEKAQRCELVQRMKILPDSAKKMLRSYFRNIGMRPAAIEGTVQSSTVEVSDNNIYDYYYYPGIPVKVSVNRETRIDVLEDKVRQKDQTIIERIELP